MRLNCEPLQVKKLLRILAAFQADIRPLHLQFLAAQLLVNLDLDGQAVAVKSRNIRSIKSRHVLGFDDEILQALVQRRTQMDRSAGVRWPVVQGIDRSSCPRLSNALVNPHLLPLGQNPGLVLRQVRFHGKVGFGQIDGGFELERHRLIFSQLIDFFHYRGLAKERPSAHRAHEGSYPEDAKTTVEKGRNQCTILLHDVCLI